MKDKKCNENWHIFLNGSEKPCQCGKIQDADKYLEEQTKQKGVSDENNK